MQQSTHICLVELEIRPATEQDREYLYVLDDWRVDTRTIGNHPGFYRNGFEYDCEAVGEEEILALEEEHILELIERKVRETKDVDKNWPIRIITAWRHSTTLYPSTVDWPEEAESELELIGEVDINVLKIVT